MPRELKPHGTWAAYMRHQRAGERPCPACAQAARTRNNDRYRAMKANTEVPIRDEPAAPLPTQPAVDDAALASVITDQLLAARQDLARVEQYMARDDLLPSAFTSLSKRRHELIETIQRLTGAREKEKPNALDELARRRADRSAAAQG